MPALLTACRALGTMVAARWDVSAKAEPRVPCASSMGGCHCAHARAGPTELTAASPMSSAVANPNPKAVVADSVGEGRPF